MIRILVIFTFVSQVAFGEDFMRVAHRGSPMYAPENTLSSFQLAIKHGANYLELDVHQSKDGELVVIHDSSVNRTSTGKGRVSNLTFAQIRSFDAGGWYGRRFKGLKIPPLREVLGLLNSHPGLKAIIELKGGNDSYPGIEDKVVSLITELDLKGRVILKSFDPRVLKRLKAALPEVPQLYVFVLAWDLIPFTISTALTFESPFNVPVSILQPHYYFVTKNFIDRAHEKGYRVVVWGVDSESQIEKTLKLGADGIETDDLLLLDRKLRTHSSP